jgi:uncharacterized repeat protein (TIGR01451 family)
MRRTLALLAIAGLLLGPAMVFAQSAPITRFTRYVGNMNFVATGGSLRTQSSNGDACAVGPSSTASVTGVPAGATIVAAYLYWGGSGATVDSSVTLNAGTVTASRTFTTTFVNGGTNFPYFGGFADVTGQVTGNGAFTFGALTVNTGAPHCDSAAVVAGWGLVVIYERAGEDLRAINVFDGLQFFRGSAVTLNPDGFRVPASSINGRMAIVAWEGDPGNSTPLNGFSESLSFNGATLDDGINVAGSDPAVQPYDGTVNTLGVSTSYGADIDTFTVDPYISQGQISATTVFSAGGDLVLLTAQVVSVSSEPVVDLSLTKTHSDDFVAGSAGTYTLRVSNGSGVGVEPEDNPVTVTDTLPAGLTFVSGSGTGWSCSAAAQVVTCTHPPPVPTPGALPDLLITVMPGPTAAPSVTNSATVSSPSLDVNAANNTATDPTNVRLPILSTSTKTFVDVNGGDANPGDTLRYTITLTESAGFIAPNVSVTDDMPANVDNLTVTTVPAGAVNNSTGAGTGTNGNGFLDVSSITVPANGSVTVVFEVRVAGGTPAGATIDNTASVNNPNGPGATPSAPQIVVSQSQIPSSGAKPLYFSASMQLSRTPPAAPQTNVIIASANVSRTWTLTPALAADLTLPAQNVPVQLWLTRVGAGTTRNVQVTLAVPGVGTLGTSATLAIVPPTVTPQLFTFSVPIPATTLSAGRTITATVLNVTAQVPRPIAVWPIEPGGGRSNVGTTSSTVINVDSLQSYNSAYPGGVVTTNFAPGATAFMRAVVSDPFGSFDIADARLTLLDPNGVTVLNGVAMTQVADSGAATRTYELSYTFPGTAAAGAWTMRVVATEGTEATVTDLGVGALNVVVPLPALVVAKTSQVISDPFNNTVNPKRIPGSIQLYSVTITNQGPGTVDASTLTITDRVPANSVLYVSTASGDPIVFIDGAPLSGLTYNYATHVTYSNQPGGGAPYSYTPVPDVSGFDPNVTGFRVAPAGTMNAAVGAGNPNFTVRFRVRLQ